MRFRWDRKYLYWGVTAFIVVCCCLLFNNFIGDWKKLSEGFSRFVTVLSPILYAFVFAFLLAPICNFLEKNCFLPLGNKLHKNNQKRAKKFARWFSVAGSIVCGLMIIALLLYLILPRTYESVKGIVTRMPEYVDKLIVSFNKIEQSNLTIMQDLSAVLNTVYQGIEKWMNTTLMPNMGTILTGVSTGVVSAIRVVFNTLVGLIVAAYLLYDKEYFIAQAKKATYCIFTKKTANSILETSSLTYNLFGNYISARIVDSFIIGILCYIGMLILRIPEAELISVMVCITNIIPFFGPFLGAIPSALILLLEDPMKCFVFCIFILCLQQLDGNIIGPHILGNSMGLNKFWVMLALLVGALEGFVGMICAVPVFAVLYTIARTIINNRLQKMDMPIDTKEYMNLKGIDEKTGEFIPQVKAPRVKPEKETKNKKPKKKASQ